MTFAFGVCDRMGSECQIHSTSPNVEIELAFTDRVAVYFGIRDRRYNNVLQQRSRAAEPSFSFIIPKE